MKKFLPFIFTLLLIYVVFSSFHDGSISVYSLLSTLSDSSELTSGAADEMFRRFYEVPTELTTYTITSDWGYLDFLRLPLSYLVRAGAYLLDIGNYLLWFVDAIWTALVYFVNLITLFFGL